MYILFSILNAHNIKIYNILHDMEFIQLNKFNSTFKMIIINNT